MTNAPLGIEVFSTCPPHKDGDARTHLSRVADVAAWSEEAGYQGILIYTENSQVDPWLLAEVVVQSTTALCPLVAVQPTYMHPYSVAKMVTSFGYLWGRRLYLNMVAGGFTNDLKALNDTTPHDRRYDRLVEYTSLITALVATGGPLTCVGDFYQTSNLRLSPPLDPALQPGVFLSGSSDAGLAAAEALGATAVRYPKSAEEGTAMTDRKVKWGIRVGFIARDTDEEAWAVANARFPDDRKGALTHQLATKVSDSRWYLDLAEQSSKASGVYWLGPFQRYQTMCPYLVGSYTRVAEEFARYLDAGCSAVILDVLPDQDECRHISEVFAQATHVSV